MSSHFRGRPTGLLLRLAHQKVRAAANHALRPLGIDVRHMGVLSVLADRGPCSQRQLIDTVETDKSSMVFVVDRLERLGLVRRERSTVDRRAYDVVLTDAGRDRLAAAVKLSTDALQPLLAPLSADEEAQLNELLARIVQHGS